MKRLFLYLLAVPLVVSGCYSNTAAGAQTGAAWGSTIGSAIGSIAGNSSRSNGLGTLIGMAGGAMAGAAVGAAMDRRTAGTTAQQWTADRLVADEAAATTAPALSAAPQATTSVVIREVEWDDNGDLTLSAGETARLTFHLYNASQQALTALVPVVEETTGAKHIAVSPSLTVERLEPGVGVKYTAVVMGQKGLKAGTARFRVYVRQGDDIVSLVEELPVVTAKK